MLRQLKDVLKQWPFIAPAGRVVDLQDWIAQGHLERRWYGSLRGDVFEPRYAAGLVLHPLPDLEAFPEHAREVFRSVSVRRYPDAFVALLRNARIRGASGCVLSRSNKIIDQSHHSFDTDLSRRRFQRRSYFSWSSTRTNGTVALLAAPESQNYYHFVFDLIPRLALLETWSKVIDKYAVPASLMPAQTEALDLLGITEARRLVLTEHSHLQVANLVLPSLPGSEGCYPPWAIEFLRGKVRDLARGVVGRGDRIFVLRGASANRPLHNEVELEAIAKAQGFQSVRLEQMTFLEQIATFRDAEVVVGAHGAGFANIVFAERARLLEIMSGDYIRLDCYFTLCSRLGFDYRCCISPQAYDAAWGSTYVEPCHFEQELSRILRC